MLEVFFVSVLIVSPVLMEPTEYKYHYEVNKSYKYFPERKAWIDAISTCKSEGGQLAIPTNLEETKFLASVFENIRNSTIWIFWIGYHDSHEEGKFIGINDSKKLPESLKWAAGEPDEITLNVGQDCVLLDNKGLLCDEPCDKKRPFFCEKSKLENAPDLKDYNLFYFLWPKNFSLSDIAEAMENNS